MLELHFDYPSGDTEQKKASHIHPNSPFPFFFICYWRKWGQLLEISVQPCMPQWWLSLRLMHLIYLFGISEILLSSLWGVPGPISCSVRRYTLPVSILAWLVRLWLSPGRSRVGKEQAPNPSSMGAHQLKKKNGISWNIGQGKHKRLVFTIFPSNPSCLLPQCSHL